jgi:hypothetical protein
MAEDVLGIDVVTEVLLMFVAFKDITLLADEAETVVWRRSLELFAMVVEVSKVVPNELDV